MIEKIIAEYDELVDEVYRLRRENEELNETCRELYDFFREATKPNVEGIRAMIELAKMIPQN